MNETIQNLITRRSIRKFKQEQIKDYELQQILEAGTYAPTGMGKQSPKINECSTFYWYRLLLDTYSKTRI